VEKILDKPDTTTTRGHSRTISESNVIVLAKKQKILLLLYLNQNIRKMILSQILHLQVQQTEKLKKNH